MDFEILHPGTPVSMKREPLLKGFIEQVMIDYHNVKYLVTFLNESGSSSVWFHESEVVTEDDVVKSRVITLASTNAKV